MCYRTDAEQPLKPHDAYSPNTSNMDKIIVILQMKQLRQ